MFRRKPEDNFLMQYSCNKIAIIVKILKKQSSFCDKFLIFKLFINKKQLMRW